MCSMANYKDDNKSTWRGRGHYYALTTFSHDVYKCAESTVALRDNSNYAGRITFETAPSTGRKHLHVFLYSRNKKSWAASKTWLYEHFGCTDGAVIELKTLAHAQNMFEYTGKGYTRDEDPVLFGGKDVIPSNVRSGAGCPESGPEGGGSSVTADWKRRVIILFGPNSTGKSYVANAECRAFSDEQPFMLQAAAAGQNGRWPGGYAGERTCIIDEFGFNDFPIAQLKMLLDRQPQEVATASGGKSVLWTPELIYLCCNTTPAEMKEFADHPQWLGRIHEIRFMNVKVQAPGATPLVWANMPVDGNPNYADGEAYRAPDLPAPPLRRKRSIARAPAPY